MQNYIHNKLMHQYVMRFSEIVGLRKQLVDYSLPASSKQTPLVLVHYGCVLSCPQNGRLPH